jgi:hypothetical protein
LHTCIDISETAALAGYAWHTVLKACHRISEKTFQSNLATFAVSRRVNVFRKSRTDPFAGKEERPL